MTRTNSDRCTSWRARSGGAAALAAALLVATPTLAAQQAPMLDPLVESGELPPVDERLPENPLVVTPVESVGTYGGTWRSALRGGLDNAWIARTVAYDGLLRYDREWGEVIPNLAESWEVSEDARTFTFKLRDGLKWNNGTPFTTADIEFAVQLLKEPTYAVGGFVKNPNNPVEIEVVDDTTFRFVFEQPNGVILDELASVNGLSIVSLSKDYCGQFYPGTNPNAAEEAKAAGFETWELRMQDRCSWATETIRWANPDLPFMNAWKVVEPLTGNATRVVFERNPYYWKVDTEGEPAALHRPARDAGIRLGRGADADGAQRRDRLPGPPHRHDRQPADLLRRAGGRRLPHGPRDPVVLEHDGDPVQPQPRRREAPRALRQQGLPHRRQPRHRPHGDHRRRLHRRRASRSRWRRGRNRRSSTRRSPSNTPSTTPTSRRSTSRRPGSCAAPTACMPSPTARRSSSPSTPSPRYAPSGPTCSS